MVYGYIDRAGYISHAEPKPKAYRKPRKRKTKKVKKKAKKEKPRYYF